MPYLHTDNEEKRQNMILRREMLLEELRSVERVVKDIHKDIKVRVSLESQLMMLRAFSC